MSRFVDHLFEEYPDLHNLKLHLNIVNTTFFESLYELTHEEANERYYRCINDPSKHLQLLPNGDEIFTLIATADDINIVSIISSYKARQWINANKERLEYELTQAVGTLVAHRPNNAKKYAAMPYHYYFKSMTEKMLPLIQANNITIVPKVILRLAPT